MVSAAQLVQQLNACGISIAADNGQLKTKAAKGKLTEELATQIRQRKQELLSFLASDNDGQQVPRVIAGTECQEIPLSFAQQRLWLLDQIEGGSAHYNMPFVLRLSGKLDRVALETALNGIVSRHSVLRTIYLQKDNGDVIQHVMPECVVALAWQDLTNEAQDKISLRVSKLQQIEAGRPFDLSRDLMLRAAVLSVSSQEHVLLLTLHHIASDGWSMGILLQELSALYNAAVQGREAELTPLLVQYADYALWQRSYLQGEVLEQQLGYWTTQLADLPVVHSLTLDNPRPATASFDGDVHMQHLPLSVQEGLRKVCQSQGATLFMGVQALFAAFLSRYSGERDIVMGTPAANREQAEIAGLIGFFVNSLVLRSDIDPKQSLIELIGASRQMLLDAYAHQQVPFDKVVEVLQPVRSAGHSPLFQIMLSWQQQGSDEGVLCLDGLTVVPAQGGATQAKYELSLTAAESAEGLVLAWEYNTALFSGRRIERMAGHFAQFVQALVQSPALAVGDAPLLSAAEREQLHDWHGKTAAYPEGCLHQLVEQQAEANPTAIAVVDAEQQLTYGELNAQANRLARYLREQRLVSSETLVGICLERSSQLIVSILAVLKAGGAYVPLDPAYPQERLSQMLADAALGSVLTLESQAADWLPAERRVALDSAAVQGSLAGYATDNLNLACQPEQLAYVIYTSGSTGTPKGVMVEHRNVVALSYWHTQAFCVDRNAIAAQTANIAFDASVWELWPYLLAGSCIVQLANEQVLDTNLLSQCLADHQVTHCFLVTPLALQFIQHGEYCNGHLQYLLVGGDALPKLDMPALPFALINNYGPTECTVVATSGLVDLQLEQPTIGKPIDNTLAYVLDSQQQRVPVGISGELYVGGAGLARGYLNRPELTLERFIANPFAEQGSAERLYRTGDVVRWREDGQLEYLGRDDHQVKVRGYRIELGEIESALQAQEGIAEALVLARDTVAGKQLVAYYRAEQSVSVDVLRQRLSLSLPDYMVPSHWLQVSEFALTANGKVDRKALPLPEVEAGGEYEAPQGETEQALAGLWQELLGVEAISRHANFFMLGGHSLLASRLVAKLRQVFDIELSVKSLFEAPVLSHLAQRIAQQVSTPRCPPVLPVARHGALALSFAQQRLWLLDQIEGGSVHYNMPFALRLCGRLDAEALQVALDGLVCRHEILRTSYHVNETGDAYQHISSPGTVPVSWQSVAEEALDDAIALQAGRPFDLSRDLMLRAAVLSVSSQEHVLLLTLHHIASDGWSMGILLQELSALYNAAVQGREAELTPLLVQYADYALWQRSYLQGEVLEQQLGYWTTQLADLPVVHSLTLDNPRPATASFDGDVHMQHLPLSVQEGLRKVCQSQGATLFMGVQALFAAFLSRYSGERDIVMGTPAANREQAEIAGLIGFFVNSLVLRSDIDPKQSLIELIGASRQMLLDAYAHQQVPFDKVVEVLQPVRSAGHSPLFQIMLSWQQQGSDEGVLCLDGLTVVPAQGGATQAKYELSLTAAESAEGLVLAWEYNTALFSGRRIERMAGHFAQFVQALVQSPALAVGDAPLLSAAEREQLHDWHGKTAAYPEGCLHQLVEQQAEANPTAIAVVDAEQQLTYGELNAQANRLARYLREQRLVSSETLVGICLERSSQLIVSILAVLKAGGAYVPLDPAYPQERLSQMLADAALGSVLTLESQAADWLPAERRVALDSAAVQDSLAGYATDNLNLACQPEQLAYVMYTSGSTGTPKGVMVEHRNLMNYQQHMLSCYQLQASDRVLQFSTPNFDIFVEEFIAALCNGGALVLRSDVCLEGPLAFKAFGREQGVTVISLPTAFFHELQSLEPQWFWPELRLVIVGGEALSANLARRFVTEAAQVRLLNTYGPTETTITATHFEVTPSVASGLPIGAANLNSRVYVLDSQQQRVPVGISGELYVGGAGLARGYLNRPELTLERFIANPFAEQGSAERLYRTGDVVRWREDGQLEYLGRDDHQVKVRGYRIELGEIESALQAQEGIAEALVLARDTVAGKQLVAYYRAEQSVSVDVLRQRLSLSLPDYMVPSHWLQVSEFALTANGKVDRKALPLPEVEAGGEYEAPQGETEQALAGLWQELLGVEAISRHANFFMLGGHSLLASRLVAKLRQVFDIELSVKSLFEAPVLSHLAQRIAQQVSTPRCPPVLPVARHGALALSFAQQRLWLLDQIEGGSVHYNMPFALRLCGRLDAEALQVALDGLVCRHEILRTSYHVNETGDAYQHISSPGTVPVSWQSVAEEALDDAIALQAGRPFDLSRDLMLRAAVLSVSSQEHVLLLTLHHIASDGWSMGILLQELSALYNAAVQGREAELTPLLVQYADYALWQRSYLQGEVLEQQLGYWTTQLADLPVVHSLTLDNPRPATASFDGDVHMQHLPLSVQEGLRKVCQSQGATLFMGVQALFAAFLSRYSGERDIVMGTPAANREQAEIAGLIGFFVNSLVLRSDIDPKQSLIELIGASRQMLLDAYAHQQVPFDKVVEVLQPVRSAGHSPLFQIMLSWQQQGSDEGVLCLDGLTVVPAQGGATQAKYELSLTAAESAEGLVLAWEYNTALFSGRRIERMAGHFAQFVQALVQSPALAVGDAPLLSAKETAATLFRLDQHYTDNSNDIALYRLFEQQVSTTPDAVAVISADTELTYRQLNDKANQLANYLIAEFDIGPDKLVALCLPRSAEMLIAVLAVWKASGAYVPLTPDLPAERMLQVLDESQCQVILCLSDVDTILQQRHFPVLRLDDIAALPAGDHWLNNYCKLNLLQRAKELNQLAYVLYTSGSTGAPKGVMIEHQSLAALATDMHGWIAPDSRVGWCANVIFDASVQGLVYLCLGRSLVIIPQDLKLQPEALCTFAKALKVSALDCTPGLIQLWLQAWPEDFRPDLLVGGEAISATLWQSLVDYRASGARVYNLYGPTECAVNSTVARIEGEYPHIGRALSYAQLYILAPGTNKLAPAGSVGELCIGGQGLGRGYLNQPELTATRFIDNPFYSADAPHRSQRLYRTGDLVRQLPDGNLAFIGRNDHQVKVRGYRIELGEIESALQAQEGIAEALVLARDTVAGKQLVAYYRAEQSVSVDVLRQRLSLSLPDYMVPSHWLQVSEFALTANGKVDRKALPLPEVEAGGEYEAPQGETEQALAGLWQELLGVEAISRHANFFMLGGHSLLASRLVAKLRQVFDIELSVKSLFEAPVLSHLAQRIAQQVSTPRCPPVLPVARHGALALSFAQQRLWLLDQIEGGSVHYNMPFALRLCGRLDAEALQVALDGLVCRHEILRTSYHVNETGDAYQHISSPGTVPVSWQSVAEEALDDAIALQAGRPFDLSRDLMLRAAVLSVSSQEHVLLLTLHHIASDGWSMGILLQELSALYNAAVQGREAELTPLLVQYADYALWQRSYLQGEVLEQQLGYWTTQLADLPVVHSLTLDNPRPATASFDGDVHMQHLPLSVQEGLRKVCQSQGATLFMGVQALFAAFLSRYSGERDIVMGTPAANREQAEIAGLIGFFVNSLVLRSDIDPKQSLIELIGASRQMLLDAYAHQQVPFDKVVEVLQPVRSAGHSPLFQIMLSWQQQGSDEGVLCLDGLTVVPAQGGATQAKYELSLTAAESAEGLVLAWEYNTALFSGRRIERMAGHFAQFVQALVQSPALAVGDAPLLSAAEREQLHDWHGKTAAYPEGCLHQLVEQQAEANPTAIAVVDAEQQLTYGELNAQANRLARYLREQRLVSSETLVGICLERSSQLIVSILAVLKAGGAYVPLDPAYPQERLSQMLADAALGSVLTLESQAADWLPAERRVALDSAAVQDSLAGYATDNLNLACQPEQLAYVMYTSGSTGTPKGVMVEHRNLMNYQQHMLSCYQLQASDRVLQFSTPNFDIFVEEFIAALCNGGALVLRSDVCLEGPLAFKAFGREQGVTVISLPTAFFHELQSLEPQWFWPELRLVIVGGEALSANLARRFVTEAAQVRLLNTYGPTETTITATHFEVTPSVASGLPIGAANLNSRVYVLDSQQQRVPVGISGELYVGGAGLARGYLNRPELTLERFIANPFAEQGSAERLYRTGDVVRWREDGQLEYLGRDDHQVKVRGYRIELGEIESALQAQEGIAEALVLARDTVAGKQLVAYYRAEQSVSVDVLRQRLSLSLPDYMVPSHWLQVSEFALTANGKVDRKALPLPEVEAGGEYEAPQGETEQALAGLWQELLGVEAISRHANFFMLGGHSLLLIRLRLAIKTLWQQELSIQQLLAKPVLVQQANLITAGVTEEKQICHLIKDGDTDNPVFIVHPVGGDTLCYQQLLHDWSMPNAVFGICHPLVAGREFLLNDGDLTKLASLYVHEIRAVQANGPYRIMGWSLGGVISLEIASQLYKQGDDVEYLGLLDSYWNPSEQACEMAQQQLSEWTPELFTVADWQLFDEEHQLAALCQITGLSLAQQRALVWSGIDILARYHSNTALHIGKVQYFSAIGAEHADDNKAACAQYLRQISGQCQIIELNATHHTIVNQPNTSIINAWVQRALQHTEELQTGLYRKPALLPVCEMEIQGEIK